MSEAREEQCSGAEEDPREQLEGATAAPATPNPPPSEPSSAGGSSSSGSEQQSDLLQKIKSLVDTQRSLKEQKKKCAQEIKNVMKRKKRLQGKASMLSDADLLEVLRMRKAKKDSAETTAGMAASHLTQPAL